MDMKRGYESISGRRDMGYVKVCEKIFVVEYVRGLFIGHVRVYVTFYFKPSVRLSRVKIHVVQTLHHEQFIAGYCYLDERERGKGKVKKVSSERDK